MSGEPGRVGRGLVGLAIVLAVVPLTPAALDETMLVKAVGVVAVVVGLAAWWLAGSFTHHRVTVIGGTPTWAMAVFALLVLAAAAWSPFPALSLVGSYERYTGAIGYAAYAGLGIAVVRWFRGGRADRVVAWVLAGSLGVVTYGLVQLADLDPVNWSGRFSPAVIAQFGNPDFVAGYIGMVLPMAVWAAVWSGWQRPARAVAGALVPAAILVLVGAGAVQGYVTAAVGVLVLLTGVSAATPGRRPGLPAGLGALAVGGLAVVVAGFAGLGPGAALWEASTARSRRSLWAAAWEMIVAEPLSGVGLSLYGRFYHAFRPLDEAVRRDLDEAADAAHNVFLNLAAGGGALVALAWGAIAVTTMVVFVRGWRRGDARTRGLLAALGAGYVGYHVQAAVSIDVPPLAATSFVLVGAITAASGSAGLGDLGETVAPAQTRRRWIAAGVAVPIAVILAVVLWADRMAGHADSAAERGAFDEARTTIATAIELAPWQPAYHFQQARILADGSDLDGALAAIDDVIDRDPRDLAAWISRGRLLTALERPLEAVEAYVRARELAPTSPQLGVEYAEALVEVGETGRARSILIDVLETAPGFTPAAELLRSLDR